MSASLEHPGPVERIPAPDLRRFRREIMRRRQPVVITGAIDHWQALRSWTPGYVSERYSDRRVRCHRLEAGTWSLNAMGFNQDEVRLGDFMKEADRAGSRHRLLAQIPEAFPELLQDIEVPEYCRDTLALRITLWITPPGTVSRLHYDLPENLMAQVTGEKRFVFFSPDQARLLYPHSFRSPTPQFCYVNLESPDLAAYPRFKSARPLECTLVAGDLLYLPSRWWHWAKSDSANMAVNFWWLTPLTYPVHLAGSFVYKKLRGVRY